MNVAPGSNIPFWYKTWDGNADIYVVAHLTDQFGNELSGSPYELTPNDNAIYSATGPIMGTSILAVYYQAFLDEELTQLDRSYLDAFDWVEPAATSGSSRLIYVSTPLIGKVSNPLLKGSVSAVPEPTGLVMQGKIKGLVTVPRLTGVVITPEITG